MNADGAATVEKDDRFNGLIPSGFFEEEELFGLRINTRKPHSSSIVRTPPKFVRIKQRL